MKLTELWRKWVFLFRRNRFNAELEEEMRLHAELRAEALQTEDEMDPETAADRARRSFGNSTRLKEQSYETWSIRWLEEFALDMRFAIRQMRKTPGYTLVAVLSLALGIAANTAIFSVIESTILRPIAVQDLDRLRLLTWRSEEGIGGWVAPNLGYRSPTYGWFYEQRPTPDGALIHAEFPSPFYRTAVQDNTTFESLFGFKELGRVTVMANPDSQRAGAEPVNAFLVSGNFYQGVKVTPALGRLIGPEDDRSGENSAVAVISYEYWTRRFARSLSVVGTKLSLNGTPLTIIGVNPESFTGIVPGGHFEIWAPLHLPPSVYGAVLSDVLDDSYWRIQMMGRLRPGVSDAQAQSWLNLKFQQYLDATYLDGRFGALLQDPAKRPRLLLQSGARGVDYVTDHYERMLVAVLSLAALVLLIACANVASLLLAKSESRQREISLRLAIGASRGRIARQLLAEGLPLAGLAGWMGLGIGYLARNGIPALLATPWRPNPFVTSFDSRVLLACLGITLVTGVLFSLAPVLQSRRIEANEAMKDGARGTAGVAKGRAGRVLAALQIALSVVLLVGAGFIVRTLQNLSTASLGVRPEGVMLFTLEPPSARDPAEQLQPLLARIQEALQTIPGVESATFTGNPGYAYIGLGNQEPQGSPAGTLSVGSRFFETMGIPILHGRAIDGRDGPEGPRAVVVNQEFARRIFQQDNVVGRIFRASDATGGAAVNPGKGTTQYQIVGVCVDWHVDQLRDPIRASFYSAWQQTPSAGRIHLKLRIAGDAARVTRQVGETVQAIDPRFAVTDARTLAADIDDSLSQERLVASLASVFGSLALLLALIGIYGVIAYSVARRTSEIGIRMALGARPGGIAWAVLRETLLLVGGGVALGVPAALALGPVLDRGLAPAFRDRFSYGVNATDPAMIASAVLVLMIVALLAGYLPARRAVRVDPMVALRHD